MLSRHPRNTALSLRFPSTEFFVNFTSHPLSHNCGSASKLCARPGNRYAVLAYGGNCGRLRVMLAVVVMVVPFGMVIVFGELFCLLSCPKLVFFTNVSNATESNSAVFALLYSALQGLKCVKVILLLKDTFLYPSGAPCRFGFHSLLAKEPPMMFPCVASFLCPMHGVPQVALLCPFRHLNP